MTYPSKYRQFGFFLVLFVLVSGVIYPIDYTVQKGDTLFGIAKLFSVSAESIQKLNGISDPSRIRVGQVLKIPGSTYTVKSGDNLYSIARLHNISFADLVAANKLDPAKALVIGQILTLPGVTEDVPSPKTDTVKSTVDPVDNTVSVKLSTPDPKGVWPITGRQERLDGKVGGVYIDGQKGEPVFAVSSGPVVWVGPYRGFGKVVFVQSSSNLVFIYGGFDEVQVQVGDSVSIGTVIGSLGVQPHDKVPKLLFSVYRNGKPIDPETAPRG